MRNNQLTAGRQLDALVAEKVRHWTVELIVSSPWEACEEWRDEQGRRYGPDPKPYSTDIVAAMTILEPAIGYEIEKFIGPLYSVGIKFKDHTIAFGKADTLPLAICIAALEAMDR